MDAVADEKRKQRLERNRLAARESRQRRAKQQEHNRQYMRALEAQVQALKRENSKLKAWVRAHKPHCPKCAMDDTEKPSWIHPVPNVHVMWSTWRPTAEETQGRDGETNVIGHLFNAESWIYSDA